MLNNLKKIGNVKKIFSSQIAASPIGLGFEKLDRDVFDPEKAYDKVAALGVKWIRIQSGWARTEKQKGVYDFAWIDSIVDNLLSRGLQPWICLCYGNGLYNESAAQVYGAVGCPPIHSEEEKKAWHNYVAALTKRYRGKVFWYEVWNEPDGRWCWKHGPSGKEYGEFIKATAAAAREGNPDSKIIGGSTCMGNDFSWLNDTLRTGAAQVMDALTYHAYAVDERPTFQRVRALRALCHAYNPKIQIIQGETGTQSRSDGAGALQGGAWTPERQAKYLVRHMISDLFSGVMFASYFSCMDMIEALGGKVGDKASYLDYGYFGVLGADFDENGFSTGDYTPKPSYRALQTIAAIFGEKAEIADLPVDFRKLHSPRLLREDESSETLLHGGFRKQNGSCAFAYWKVSELLTQTCESTISIDSAAIPGEPKLIDLLDGSIYEIPPSSIEDNGNGRRLFKNLPLRDYPILLSFANFTPEE